MPALHVTDTADLARLAPWADDVRIGHWIVLDPATKVTAPELVASAAAVLGQRVGGGTDLYFTELNRGRPRATDVVAFSINPQVHASDDQSVMQNAVTQSTIARNARDLYPDAWLEASPITLRPRFNPNATEPELDHSNTALPSRVDARQCADFAAAWTVVSLKSISETGALGCRHLLRGDGLGGDHGARRGIRPARGLPLEGRRPLPRVRRARRSRGARPP